MADDDPRPDDLGSLWARLWGRREDMAPADADRLRAYVDAALAEQVASVRVELVAAMREQVAAGLAEHGACVRDEAVAAADARVVGAETRLLAGLDGIQEALAQAAQGTGELRDAAGRLEALEERLQPELGRLTLAVEGLKAESAMKADIDAVRTEVAHALAAVDKRLAAAVKSARAESATTAADVKAVRTEVADAAAALDERVAAAVEGLRAESTATAADLDAVVAELTDTVSAIRGEMPTRAELAASAAMAEARLNERLQDLRAEVADAELAEEVDQARAAVTALSERVDGALGDLRASIESGRAQLEGQRAGLDAATDAVAELRAQAALRGGVGRGRKAGKDDVTRLADAVESLQRKAAGWDEFPGLQYDMEQLLDRKVAEAQAEMKRKLTLVDATIADVEAELVDRLDGMAAWVVAEATRAARQAPAKRPPAKKAPAVKKARKGE